MVKKIILSTSMLLALQATGKAQTINDFEDINLSGANTTYLNDIGSDGSYFFQTGNVLMNGNIDFGGTYLTGFNCSNVTDTIDKSYMNSWAAMTGIGYNQSSNYGVIYLEAVGPNWNSTIEKALIIDTNSNDKMFNSFYINNTVWGYDYMSQNYDTGDYCNLVIKGYKNNIAQDSIIVELANFTNQLNIIKDWTNINLNKLGIVDSITFQMHTTDDFTPFYFAFDQIITSDGNCATVDSLWTISLNHESLVIEWETLLDAAYYEVAIDTYNLNVPHSATSIDTTHSNIYEFNNLTPKTNYQVFVRSICNNTAASEWKKLSVTTLPVGINKIENNNLAIYPNPTNGIVYLKNLNIQTLSIYSIDGKLLDTLINTNSIDLTNYAKGTYIIIGKDKYQQQYTSKLIKE